MSTNVTPKRKGNWADPILSSRKAQLSLAYIRAIAAGASCVVDHVENDIESVDVTIKSLTKGSKVRWPKIDVQAKCTSKAVLESSDFSFTLDTKNYEDLV
ncbi:DUF4365 domain-containing protein [candidate division KSB1 bacterium]|nr:DUF4365 domain-containing protein [candidate division KSB1 bacterium]